MSLPYTSARETEVDASATPVKELFYTEQRLDHFNAQSTATWSQRYFMRTDLYKAGGPVFVCVGGEGPPLTLAVLTASVHCNDMVALAETENALMFAIEHRYYGKSLPVPNFNTTNLQWLSSHQALADISTFVAFAKSQYSIPEAAKWVTWGGSYPGMMAGWSRYNFPHLFTAAVSSSSPMRLQFDYKGYNDVVARSTADTFIGGSQACLDVVTAGHAAIGAKLGTAADRKAVAQQFGLCNVTALEDPNNQGDWAGQGVVYIPAQENDPACTTPLCNISSICEFLLDSSHGAEPIDRLAALSKAQHGGSCVNVDHDMYVKSLDNTTLAGGTGRIWFYQTCTEFAFFQTCEKNTACPYTQGLYLTSAYTDLCMSAFNIDMATTKRRVQFSLDYWGGVDLAGSRIVFTNGDVDPWSYLGVLNTTDTGYVVQVVEGASHHFWTHPIKSTDSPQVQEARDVIWSTIRGWLADAQPVGLAPLQ